MAEDSNTLITKIILDDSDFKRGIKNVQSQVKTDASVAERVNKKTWKEEDKRRNIESKDRRERRKTTEAEERSIRRVNEYKARGYRADETARRKERDYARVKEREERKRARGVGGAGEGGAGGGGAGGRGGGRGRGGLMGRMAGGAMGMLKALPFAGVGALAGLVASHAAAGYGAYVGSAGARAGLHGLSGSHHSIDKQLGVRMGYDQNVMYGAARSIARQTGSMGAVNLAAVLSRYYGGDMGEIGSFMGSLTRGGSADFRGPEGQKVLGRVMTDAVKSGLNKSRAGEHLEAVASMIQQVGSRQAVDVDAGGISGLLSLIGRYGGEGLRGARGMNVLAGIDQGIRSGGTTEGSEAFVLQTIGFGRPGSNMDYFEAKRIQERGLFGGKDGPNIDLLMGMLKNAQEYAGGSREGAAYYLVKDGLSGNATMDQILELWDALDAAGGDSEKIKAAIEKISEEAKPIDEKMLSINEELLKVTQNQALDMNRLIKLGEDLYPLVRDLVEFLQRLVNDLLPPIVWALKLLAPGNKHTQDTRVALRSAEYREDVTEGLNYAASTILDAEEAQEAYDVAVRNLAAAQATLANYDKEIASHEAAARAAVEDKSGLSLSELLATANPFSETSKRLRDADKRHQAALDNIYNLVRARKRDEKTVENLEKVIGQLIEQYPTINVNVNATGPEPADQRVSPLDADQTAGAPGGTQ